MKLPDVNSKHGAPMGRSEGRGKAPEGPVNVFKAVLDSGGYDSGGAYWGTPNNVYCATDGNEFTEYLRAASRSAAQASIKLKFPDATFTSEPDYFAFLQGYLACAAWSGPSEDEGNFTAEDFTAAAVAGAEKECREWVDANWQHLQGLDENDCGHDFWLTRNHHGTGFWDRSHINADVREYLTKASHAAGEKNVLVSRRKKLSFIFG